MPEKRTPDREDEERWSQRARRPGRRLRSAGDAREDIIEAAQSLFPLNDLNDISIRDIARVARVDPRLVQYYFRTKETLLLEAFGRKLLPMMGSVFGESGVRSGGGRRIVLGFLQFWDVGDRRQTMAGLLRAAGSGTRLPDALRALLVNQLGRQLLSKKMPERELSARVEMLASQLFGVALVRYVFRWEPLATMSPESLAEALGPALDRYLRAPLPGLR